MELWAAKTGQTTYQHLMNRVTGTGAKAAETGKITHADKKRSCNATHGRIASTRSFERFLGGHARRTRKEDLGIYITGRCRNPGGVMQHMRNQQACVCEWWIDLCHKSDIKCLPKPGVLGRLARRDV